MCMRERRQGEVCLVQGSREAGASAVRTQLPMGQLLLSPTVTRSASRRGGGSLDAGSYASPAGLRKRWQAMSATTSPATTSHSRQSVMLAVCRRAPRYVTTMQNGAMPIAVVHA